MKHISSNANSIYKDLVKLKKSKERLSKKIFSVEGKREISRALSCGFELTSIFIDESKFSQLQKDQFLSKMSGNKITTLATPLMTKLLVRENSDRLLALFKSKYIDQSTFKKNILTFKKEQPFVLVLNQIEKPGNIGALLRTANGAGVQGVILVDCSSDLYNPNLIRSSLGTVFECNIISMSIEEYQSFAQALGLNSYAATLDGQPIPYTTADYKKPTAIILGSEDQGVSKPMRELATATIKIPMRGIADSLNVSAAGAVLIYEVLRQRNAS